MDELLVEGLTPEDFNLMLNIIKSYKISIGDDIAYTDLINLHNKIKEIVDCLNQ